MVLNITVATFSVYHFQKCQSQIFYKKIIFMMIYNNKKNCYLSATKLSYRQINVQKWVVFGVKNEKTYGLTLFHFFIKMRALW